MATDKKISELPVASAINATDFSVLVSSGTDYQFAFSTLLQFISSGLAVGANITFGTTLPQNTSGKDGDVFINTSAGSFAQKISGVWTITYTLPSSGGSTDGTVLYGLGIPGSATGNNSDTYINTGTGIFYKKSAGAWSQVFSMQTGPAGPAGANGTNGTNGLNGKTILHGTSNPSNLATGTDGDFYINTSTFTFFGPKASGVWPAGTSLGGADGTTGPTGAKGDKGDTGNPGPTGPAAADGAGVATGGTTGQVLSKNSDDDFDTVWIDPPDSGPGIIVAEEDNSGGTSTPLILSNLGTKANNTGSKISFRAINNYSGSDDAREYAYIECVQVSSNSNVYSNIKFYTQSNNTWFSVLNLLAGGIEIDGYAQVNNGMVISGPTDTTTGSGNIGITGHNLIFGNGAGYNFDFSTNSIHTGYQTLMRISDANHISIGDENFELSALLTLNSTTNGFLPPRLTTTQKDAIVSPAEGLIIYDTTLKKLCVYADSTWETITSA